MQDTAEMWQADKINKDMNILLDNALWNFTDLAWILHLGSWDPSRLTFLCLSFLTYEMG